MTETRRTIPQIRTDLIALADEIELVLPKAAERLRSLAEETKRRSPVRRAPTSSKKITPELAETIEDYALAHPKESCQSIAERFGVNSGRVSEIVAGTRNGE